MTKRMGKRFSHWMGITVTRSQKNSHKNYQVFHDVDLAMVMNALKRLDNWMNLLYEFLFLLLNFRIKNEWKWKLPSFLCEPTMNQEDLFPERLLQVLVFVHNTIRDVAWNVRNNATKLRFKLKFYSFLRFRILCSKLSNFFIVLLLDQKYCTGIRLEWSMFIFKK